MAYTITKYQSDEETIHPIRIQSDRVAEAGAAPTGETNSNIKAKISKSAREFGLRPRGVRLVRTVGTAPDTFKKYTFLPVLTETAFNTAAFAPGETITLGTVNWTISARVVEDY